MSLEQLATSGFVILEQALDPNFVAELEREFSPLLSAHIANATANRGTHRYQMHLPFRLPFSDPRVITHPAALEIIEASLGSDCVCSYFASDTPLPGSDYQDVHADLAPLFPETNLFHPPSSLVLNVPLVDFTEQNGPLELWPASHLVTGRVDRPALAKTMPSARPLLRAGSLLLRDIRLWHRGTPNRSQAARPNLAFIFARPWLAIDYPPVSIARATYGGLPERAQRLFRKARITD